MDSALIDETSSLFLGKWKRLVSTTNWDKGRIIFEWRQALLERGAPLAEYSDEAWSQRVGNITPQHVGRLRRVFERFGAVKDTYDRLYWSHFQAGADWDDAELWLEGAVQNGWSISQMRRQRWETLGGLETPPPDGDALAGDAWHDEDEDVDAFDESTGDEEFAESGNGHFEATNRQKPHDDGGGHGRRDDEPGPSNANEMTSGSTVAEPIRPFARLPVLPDDVSEAFEAFKLSILRHKLAGWKEFPREDMLATLDALKELALAPAVQS